MPGKSKAGGVMRGRHGRQDDSVGGSNPRGPVQDPVEDAGAGTEGGRGRSEASPGHLKKAAGAQSARDFAPGRGGQGPAGGGDDRDPRA
jgi:hypothetical protein